MQNLNEYLRVLSEHGVNQVPHGRQRVHNRSACTIAARWLTARLQNFAKGLTDGCFMEGFLRMKRVPGRCKTGFWC